MQASKSNQLDLLALEAINKTIERHQREIDDLKSGKSTAELRASQREMALQVLEASNLCESLNLELTRANADVTVVDSRISLDKQRLNQTSSAKDAQGIESELVTLGRRKSDLEDASLAIMQHLEEAEQKLSALMVEKSKVDSALAVKDDKAMQDLMKLQSGMQLETTERDALRSRIPADIIELFDKKSVRGTAVGRLVGRQCGSCQISLTAAAYDEAVSQPADALVFCPECAAILVRS